MTSKRPCPKCKSGKYYVTEDEKNRESWYECGKCGYSTKGKGGQNHGKNRRYIR